MVVGGGNEKIGAAGGTAGVFGWGRVLCETINNAIAAAMPFMGCISVVSDLGAIVVSAHQFSFPNHLPEIYLCCRAIWLQISRRRRLAVPFAFPFEHKRSNVNTISPTGQGLAIMSSTVPGFRETSLRYVFKAHPWHGVSLGPEVPKIVTAYIEIVPTDTVKYELDKETGLLLVDRPQRYSNVCPALYGLLPQTYCGNRVAEYCMKHTGLTGLSGDGDPLDVCVFTEKTITHGDLLMRARPIGGLRLLDGNEADDKILAVMANDAAYGHWRDVSDIPTQLLQRLQHYFLTYKDAPGAQEPRCTHGESYGVAEAYEVIRRSQEDYFDYFCNLTSSLPF